MSNDHEWLNLIEVSGPFLAVPVLRDVFPQGLEALPSGRPQRLRRTYEEWRDAVDMDDPDLPALHAAWIGDVLVTALEMDETVLRKGATLPEQLTVSMPEHGVTVAPDLAVVNPTNSDEPLLLIHVYEPDTDLDATRRFDGLAITPADRMVALLRSTGCPTGIVTNGERWMLVHAPVGAVAGFASWYARLWGQEPETLRAFVSLLGVRRFFGPDEGKLPALYERSLKHQDDVTEALGEQVRRAVEVLVQALDRADQDRNRELLRDVEPRELYEAGLTFMMRLVFLLAAEGRSLLLLGDPRYDSFYAISSLRMQLRADSEEILERRRSAWSRLLALFRGVYGGIDHPTLRLPALGGSLFDPDRYPFLEGRKKGTNWRSDPAEPLPIDDRTVLLLLEAIQTFEGRTLSYRALDVEQIGHVYEGLLERTVKRVDDVTLELHSGAKAKSPRVTLGEIESARLDGPAKVAELLKERSERSESAIRNALERAVDDRLAARLLTVCRGDIGLRDRILPYASLLRTDPWGYPLVHHKGAFVVVLGADRRESGTHYTPKSLTEKIVEETLTPVAYRGPAEGKAPEDWELKTAEELLDLKICDPAMGSGAFLVQACRWLSDRLVEAWSVTEASGTRIDSEGRIIDAASTEAFDPLSQDAEERAIVARRLIAERCLYGVDKNPLAVELAKLSLWLTTLAKGRPFGFLDHNLRSGDSLLGIRTLVQLIELSMEPETQTQLRLFGQSIREAVDRAMSLRTQLRQIAIRDIHDVNAMSALNTRSRAELEASELVADALIGAAIENDSPRDLRTKLNILAHQADRIIAGDQVARLSVSEKARLCLSGDASASNGYHPFHWPLEFPEVFTTCQSGFDALVSNPPWGAALRSELLVMWKSSEDDKLDRLVDSFHLFLIRAGQLLSKNRASCAGLLVPDVLLYQEYSKSLRRHLIKNCRLVSVCNLGDALFAGVTRPCCYVVFSTHHSANYDISVRRWPPSKTGEFNGASTLPSASLDKFPGCIIPTIRMSEYSEIARIVDSIPFRLSDLTDELGIQRGASADNKDVFVLPAEVASHENLERLFLKRVVTGGIHVAPFRISNELPVLIYTTRDTPEHSIPNIIKWVGRHHSKITCKEVKQGKHPIYALHRPRAMTVFERRVKLLGVITADRPKVAVDNQQIYALDGIFVFSPQHGVDPYYVAGVLNSELMARVYRTFSQEEGRVMAQVKPTVIAELPIVPYRSGDESMEEMAAKIASISKSLHSPKLENGEREQKLHELDELVEELFYNAAALPIESGKSRSRQAVTMTMSVPRADRRKSGR